VAIRSAKAVWEGSLVEGAGRVSTESGALTDTGLTFAARFQDASGANPEELLGAAHAGCFSMALSHALAQAGHAPAAVHTEARVQLEKGEAGFAVTGIELICEARVPGIDPALFQEKAEGAKTGCPISKALASVPITLRATLLA
jgi:lipoyl-dependent peroxiredoxin